MFTLQFQATDIEELIYKKYKHPQLLVQKRMEVIHLISMGIENYGLVAHIAGVHRDTVTDYVKLYNSAGLAGLEKLNYWAKKSDLAAHAAQVKAHFEAQPALNLAEAKAKIETLTGIKRQPSQIRHFLHQLGIRYRKIGQIPAKAQPYQQAAFLAQTLEPLIKLAHTEAIHLFFMDATHCVMGFFLSFVWSLSRYFVPSSAGRKRLNILGAVNAINQKILAIFNDTTINAEVLMDFLQQIHAQYADKPIYIVLDNARYQHCKTVKTFAQSLNIQLVFLPPYSPNLNIIERLWKWLKKKCLYAKYYPNFKDFSEAIQNTLKNANQNHQEELQKLLNLKFQTFR